MLRWGGGFRANLPTICKGGGRLVEIPSANVAHGHGRGVWGPAVARSSRTRRRTPSSNTRTCAACSSSRSALPRCGIRHRHTRIGMFGGGGTRPYGDIRHPRCFWSPQFVSLACWPKLEPPPEIGSSLSARLFQPAPLLSSHTLGVIAPPQGDLTQLVCFNLASFMPQHKGIALPPQAVCLNQAPPKKGTLARMPQLCLCLGKHGGGGR